MHSNAAAALVVGTLVAVFAATSVVADTAELVRPRKEGFRELGAAFKNVNDELKSGTPQVYIIQLSARQIRDAARAQYTWFPTGSEPQPAVKTKAKPEIWAQPAQFKTAQDKFATEAATFMSVAGTGEVPKIRAQAKQLGQACNSCHRTFRVKDED
jgi:cytochrome c556